MEWMQTWTIIGAMGALIGAVFFTLRSDIRKLTDKVDQNGKAISRLEGKLEGYMAGVERSHVNHETAKAKSA